MPKWGKKPNATPLADLQVFRRKVMNLPKMPWPTRMLEADGYSEPIGAWWLNALHRDGEWTGNFWAEQCLAVGQWIAVSIEGKLLPTRLYVYAVLGAGAGGWLHRVRETAPIQEVNPDASDQV